MGFFVYRRKQIAKKSPEACARTMMRRSDPENWLPPFSRSVIQKTQCAASEPTLLATMILT